jgi:hypothetical protein
MGVSSYVFGLSFCNFLPCSAAAAAGGAAAAAVNTAAAAADVAKHGITFFFAVRLIGCTSKSDLNLGILSVGSSAANVASSVASAAAGRKHGFQKQEE